MFSSVQLRRVDGHVLGLNLLIDLNSDLEFLRRDQNVVVISVELSNKVKGRRNSSCR
jgi:hypothetical protein